MSYPPPGYGASPQEPNRKPVLITAIVIGLTAAVGIVALLIVGAVSGTGSGGDGGQASASPKEVVQEFTDRQNSGDYATSLELWTSDGAEYYREKNWDGEQEPPQKWIDDFEAGNSQIDIGDESINGDKATVSLTETFDGQDTSVKVELVKQDGEWLIDGYS